MFTDEGIRPSQAEGLQEVGDERHVEMNVVQHGVRDPIIKRFAPGAGMIVDQPHATAMRSLFPKKSNKFQFLCSVGELLEGEGSGCVALQCEKLLINIETCSVNNLLVSETALWPPWLFAFLKL